ncbi:dTDP-4-dehydrorhamnose 3,5-epimerase [Brachyspira hyodysenteriae]|uniref:dTDP-4-dehydrorhamnose 3,5-epimerase n=1 Tax=Brachyspira hyodysenteriae (strain ATCC 49526 / WA1) TaxID=565034 RepID=A0A3B6VCK2_BRAHW|nr:dTDP-4-dehydrorhamnose 3,5-epimerase [Brachyspira hyodysenteriae]ACN85132.1 dTDP-4-dehydrorhamnose 3,5-epimerase [Brachyspira hyodysenteriae WA1]AUJ51064.1 dTDP-4-dehydrorhamnose 3,5-epimerase [Brachyspira hyodysenteriae]KLI19239.1 dTDP-4-dehydrorhamnose 3,5-epimerase [Brachyspira hyodysenteriae]KLI25392.1 dTDP-4-dehydrorhamnose 3,5-epimerase [Brachyspira hyodysenteriae]KLI27819.1 dTDP-4-dehydrorhamnose 3,5-epimerase [Brachyspira hyodysenteriae]
MTIEKTNIEGAYIIQNNYIEDERGYFLRLFCNDELKKSGIDFEVKQSNMSYSAKKGTLRGMHYQIAPYAEIKVVRCIKGKVFDAIADIRKDSPTFGQHFTVELSEENGKMIYIPPYVAHGIETLEDHSMICYFVGASFVPNAYGYLRWNDPFFNIDWPIKDNLIMSEKDKSIPDFEY